MDEWKYQRIGYFEHRLAINGLKMRVYRCTDRNESLDNLFFRSRRAGPVEK